MTEFERHTLVLLRWPAGMREFTDEELDRSQSGHLAFLARMLEAGHLVAAGPFDGSPDETLRGLCVYRTPPEETRRLVADDTAVQMGRLEPVVLEWLVPPRYGLAL